MEWNENYLIFITKAEWDKYSDSDKEEFAIRFWAEEVDQVVGDDNMVSGWLQDIHEAIQRVQDDSDESIPNKIINKVKTKVNLMHRVGKGIYAKQI